MYKQVSEKARLNLVFIVYINLYIAMALGGFPLRYTIIRYLGGSKVLGLWRLPLMAPSM